MYILVLLGMTCIIIDIVMLFTKTYLVLRIPQTLRMWTWLFYYMLGGFFYYKKDSINSVGRGKLVLVLVASVWAEIAWISYAQKNIFNNKMAIECFYGSLVVMILSSVVFVSGIKFLNGKSNTIIGWISRNTMGIYIFHPFILPILSKYIPIFQEPDSLWNVLYWIATVIVSLIVSSLVGKIPLIKSLIII